MVIKRAIKAVLIMGMIIAVCNAEFYKVGDSAGWTIIGNIDYKYWAATRTFQLGDVIIFNYNAKFHNVMRVTHAMFKTCNASTPLETYTSGNDTITIKTRGHHLFICGVPGHCQAGQKVDINVPRTNSSVLISPSPSALASPLVPVAGTIAPSPNKAVLFNAFDGRFGLLWLVLPFFAAFVPAFSYSSELGSLKF